MYEYQMEKTKFRASHLLLDLLTGIYLLRIYLLGHSWPPSEATNGRRKSFHCPLRVTWYVHQTMMAHGHFWPTSPTGTCQQRGRRLFDRLRDARRSRIACSPTCRASGGAFACYTQG